MAGGDLIGLLEVDPELGRGIAPEDLDDARRLVVGRRLDLTAGPWDPNQLDGSDPPFAILVVEGLLTREQAVGSSVHIEILGPGDVLNRNEDQSIVPSRVRWTNAGPATVALLDRHFLAAVRRWPVLSLRLYERVADQRQRASLLTAINSIRNVEQRILAILWHLVGLYGSVDPEGQGVLPMRLSHEAIGNLVGARRPTVTLAMKALSEASYVRRDQERGFVLRERSRSTLVPDQSAFSSSGGAGISSLEPLPRAGLTSSFGGESPETRALGRLREQVSILRESESGMRAMFDLAGIGVALIDASTGELLEVNGRFAEMLGSEKRALLGKVIWELLEPTKGESIERALEPLAAHRASQADLEMSFRGPGGAVTLLQGDLALFDDVEERSRLIGVFQDVTAERTAERITREASERNALRVALNDALSGTDDEVLMQVQTCELLGRYLDVTRAYIGEPERDPADDVVGVRVRREFRAAGYASLSGFYSFEEIGEQFRGGYERGETLVVNDLFDIVPEKDRATYEALGVRACIVVPLTQKGEWFASLAVTQDRARQWSPEEISFVEETALRLRVAVDRLRTERERARHARVDAYRIALNDALRESDDPIRMQVAAAALLGAHLGVDNAYVIELDETPDGRVWRLHRDYRSEGTPSLAGTYTEEPYGLEGLVGGFNFVMTDAHVWPSERSNAPPGTMSASGPRSTSRCSREAGCGVLCAPPRPPRESGPTTRSR